MNLQHVQVPQVVTLDLTVKEAYIYAHLRKYMNGDTKECFPSIKQLTKDTSSDRVYIMDTLRSFETKKYITIRKEGRKNVYKFLEHDKFEIFSYEFLNKKDLTSNEKGFLIIIQYLMYKDKSKGITNYSYYELSNIIKVSYKTICKYMKSLKEKGYLTINVLTQKNQNTGLPIEQKVFHLDKLSQEVLIKMSEHDLDIRDLKYDVIKLEKELRDLKIMLSNRDSPIIL